MSEQVARLNPGDENAKAMTKAVSTDPLAPADRPGKVMQPEGSFFEVFRAALRLGVSSFGGPIAHLGYYREDYVLRRRWLDEQTFADLVALCQFLPGPASSQVSISIGILRAGPLGGLAAWLGFTLPSAILLTLFALGVERFDVLSAPWLHGLQVVAVAVVAQAIWGMARQFSTDALRISVTILATLVVLAAPTSVGQVLVIVLAGLFGWRFLTVSSAGLRPHVGIPVSRRLGVVAWVLFFGILAGLPIARVIVHASPDGALALFDGFYRTGALVFGGGHVVLPLLQAVVVPPGWLSNAAFLAGYGAAQAVPGPLFTFSAFLGAARSPTPDGVVGAAIALIAIFLPGALLVYGSLPFWGIFRSHPAFQRALAGINAAVVGILLAALYLTIWVPTIVRPADFGLALVAFGLLAVWKRPPWQVVLFGAIGGAILGLVG
jgi:chromate transporter